MGLQLDGGAQTSAGIGLPRLLSLTQGLNFDESRCYRHPLMPEFGSVVSNGAGCTEFVQSPSHGRPIRRHNFGRLVRTWGPYFSDPPPPPEDADRVGPPDIPNTLARAACALVAEFEATSVWVSLTSLDLPRSGPVLTDVRDDPARAFWATRAGADRPTEL